MHFLLYYVMHHLCLQNFNGSNHVCVLLSSLNGEDYLLNYFWDQLQVRTLRISCNKSVLIPVKKSSASVKKIKYIRYGYR